VAELGLEIVKRARRGAVPSMGVAYVRSFFVLTGAALLVFLALAIPAVGSPKIVSNVIGEQLGTGSGSLGGLFNTPRDIAVNDSAIADGNAAANGDFYVVDETNHRIQRFNADGTFDLTWGRNVVNTGPGNDAVAPMDQFEICVAANGDVCRAGVSSAGDGTPEGNGSLANPQGVAVDQETGNVFVSDRNNRRINVYTANGEFLRSFGFDVAASGPGNTGIAYEICTHTDGDVCKVGVGLDAGGAGQYGVGTTTGGFRIDVSKPDGNPSTGSVFLANTSSERVERYNLDGTSPTNFGTAVQFAANHPLNVAVDASGIVYASTSVANNSIIRYDLNTASFIAPIDISAISGTLSSATTTGLEADRLLGNLYVARANSSVGVIELSTPGVSSAAHVDTHFTNGSLGVTSNITINGIGLGPDAGELFVARSSGGHRVYILDDDGATPASSIIDPATNVTATTAELTGEVSSNGPLATAYRLEVSRNGVDWVSVSSGTIAGGTTDQPVSGTATGLLPNTVYRVRILTTKGSGNPFLSLGNPDVASSELTFLTDATPPEITSLHADSVEDTTARLSTRINPHSTQTSYRFEYGTGNFHNVIPIPDAPIGAGPDFVFVSQKLTGLETDTTYQFRLVATSATAGVTTSPTKIFTTQSAAALSQDRAYELVSPPDKVGGAGVGEWHRAPAAAGHAGFAAHDGERFAVGTSLGSMLLDGAQAWASDWAFADRMSDEVGWVSHSPFTHSSPVNAFARYVHPHAATPDLSRVSWGTNNTTMTIFPEMASSEWNQFQTPMLSDWAGRWEIFGPTDLAQLAGNVSSFTERLWEVVFSADGAHVAATTDFHSASNGAIVLGLGGPEDPTHMQWPDLVAGRSIYVGDLSDGLADSFVGTGERELVNVCTGADAERTLLPARDGSGKLMDQTCPSASAGRDAHLVSDRGATMNYGDAGNVDGAGEGTLLNVVSSDGSRLFFMSPDPLAPGVPNGVSSFCSGTDDATLCPPQLYVRQVGANGEPVVRWISRAEDGLFGTQDATLTGQVRFEGATPDGDKVFFRTNSPLTADDPNGTGVAPVNGVIAGNASNSSWDLYRYDFPDDPDADPAGGTLTRVSAGPGLNGDCNSPFGGGSTGLSTAGALRFVSDDGTRAYFTCAAPLPGVPAPSNGTITSPAGTQTTSDATNLYLFDANRPQAERWRFVTRLPRAGGALLPPIANCASNGVNRSVVMVGREADLGFQSGNNNCVSGVSDGSFIVFFADGRLTADDPVSPATADIYAYDSKADELIRITAPQGGVGGTYTCVGGGFLDEFATPPQCHGDPGFGGTEDVVRRGPPPTLGLATAPLVDGVRLAFFQSRSRLVSEDTDDAYDVYQWRNGELSLVSTGSSDADRGALYVGNDRTGRNVYFFTTDRLAWQDYDGVGDVYTARVDGGIPEPVAPVLCDAFGGACQGGGAGSTAVDVGSSSPSSEGNAPEGKRKTLTVSAPGLKVRRRAAHAGVLAVTVAASEPGKVIAVAKSRIRKRARRVGHGSLELREAGRATLRLRLSGNARRLLRNGRSLRMTVRVTSRGARPQSLAVRLPGAGS
jgi:NHL repeat